MGLRFILKMLKPLLGDIEKKLAQAMIEQDAEYGSKNTAFLIRRIKAKNSKGEIIDTCQMCKVDITDYTAVENDQYQEYSVKALFIKDKNITSGKDGNGNVISYPNGKNISEGIEGIFANVTSDKEDDE